MERHTARQFLIAERMAADRGLEVDRELLLCAAFLHDAGLYPSATTGDVYVADSRRLAERILAPFGWEEARLARCLDAIEQHHSPRSRWDWGTEVELVRRSDLVDVSRGAVSFGVRRSWLRALFREIPRKGLYPLITRALWHSARQHPRNIPRIFTPPSEPSSGR
jgi:HD domain